jgi:hypothetical protein
MNMILSLLLLADVGPKPLSYAGQPTPLKDMKGVEVEMASEEVKLVLHRAKLDVEVVFHMLNHGGDVDMEEGFPVGPYETMKGFAITIDGKPVPFKLVDRAAGVAKREASDFWYVWTAPFKAGARHTHVVKYTLDLQHQRFYHETGYVLHTGAAWKNPIGRADVTLTFGEGVSVEHLRGVKPFDAARIGSDRVTWRFENLEPTKEHDIFIRYDLETWKEDVEKLRADPSWYGRYALTATLKELPAWKGRKDFTPEERKDYLDALRSLVSELKRNDGVWTFPTTDPERVSGPPELTKLFEGRVRLRYYLLEDDLLRTFQRYFDDALAVARTHPAEAKETLQAYRHFLGRLADGSLHLDYGTLKEGKNAGKVLSARALKPEEKKTLEAKLAEADALLK